MRSCNNRRCDCLAKNAGCSTCVEGIPASSPGQRSRSTVSEIPRPSRHSRELLIGRVEKSTPHGRGWTLRVLLLTLCRKVRFCLRFLVSSGFTKPRKINRLPTIKDSIPIAVRPGLATSPHLPQPPAATFKRLIKRARNILPNSRFGETRVRLITSVTRPDRP
jgi:hypothetical protein